MKITNNEKLAIAMLIVSAIIIVFVKVSISNKVKPTHIDKGLDSIMVDTLVIDTIR